MVVVMVAMLVESTAAPYWVPLKPLSLEQAVDQIRKVAPPHLVPSSLQLEVIAVTEGTEWSSGFAVWLYI